MTLYKHDSQIVDSYNIHANLGTELLANGKIDEALFHMKKSATLVPYEINLNNIGSLYERKGDIAKAKEYYIKAFNAKSYYLPTHQHSQQLYVNLINLLIFQDELTEAKPFLDAGLKDYPKSSKLWILKSIFEYKLHNKNEALKAAQQAYALEPNQINKTIFLNLSNNKSLEDLLKFK